MNDNYEKMQFEKYMRSAEIDKAYHTLEGIIAGILIDSKLNSQELDELFNWCTLYSNIMDKYPFNQIRDTIASFKERNADDVEIKEQLVDLAWVLKKYVTENIYFDVLISDMQKLHGILADNVTEDEEIMTLSR